MSMRNQTVLLAIAWLLLMPIDTRAQRTPKTDSASPDSAAADGLARKKILQSTEWRRLLRSFDEWLSVQNIHTDEQIDKIKADLNRRVETMNATELEDFIDDMEQRLEVLQSDKAKDARNWLGHLTMAGRQRRLAPDGELPNVFEMTAGQLRQELRQFQQQRAGRAAAQGDFNRLREQRVSAAAEKRRAQQRAQEDAKVRARERASDAAIQQQQNNTFLNPYAPRAYPTSPGINRSLYVTPWGGIATRYRF
jgi:hypothetical protein